MHQMRHFLSLVEGRQGLSEAPIDIGVIGDPQTPGAFRQDDLTLVSNPKSLAKIHRLWRSSVVDVDLYLFNDSERPDLMASLAAAKRLTLPEFRALGLGKPKPDRITAVLTQNEGDERVPLTGWMIAHRLFHVLEEAGTYRPTRFNINGRELISPTNRLLEPLSNLLRNLFDLARRTPYEGRMTYRQLWAVIGTTRAAREGLLTQTGELIPEAFAQFMLRGQVRFGEFPESLTDIEGRKILGDAHKVARLNAALRAGEISATQIFGKLIQRSIGKAFIL